MVISAEEEERRVRVSLERWYRERGSDYFGDGTFQFGPVPVPKLHCDRLDCRQPAKLTGRRDASGKLEALCAGDWPKTVG